MSPERTEALWQGYLVFYFGVLVEGELSPKDSGIDALAMFALAAHHAKTGEPPMTRSALLSEVARMLGEDAPEVPPPAADHDPTQAALEAYAEGRADELEALEKWAPEHVTYPGGAHVSLSELALWVASRRASAPKRGMMAVDVLARIDRWHSTDQGDNDCESLSVLLRKIGEELEGATR